MTALNVARKVYNKFFPYKKRGKILLVQLANRNLGDLIIADNTCKMLEQSLRKNRFSCKILRYNIKNQDVFQVKCVDAVVFSGGGLVKFKAENFYELVPGIISECEKYSVPVFVNSVGVEGYDEEDERCQFLKEALNLPCVKGITTRDDLKTLKENYITNENIRVKNVFDPAVWCDKTYPHINHCEKSGVIGLGIAREGIFTDHGIEKVDREFLLDFWKDTAKELENQGFKWKIFTNGLDKDEAFAKEVLSYIGYGEIEIQPAEPHHLVENICKLDGIIATRMHSNIVAFSKGIPSVGLVWNDKLSLWGEKIGYPERFVLPENLEAKYVVDTLVKAMGEKQKKLSVGKKNACFKELNRFVKKYCTTNERAKIKIDYKKYMLATALGGMEFKYKNTNSLEAFEKSLSEGYRNFETDVRLSADEKLVLVNRWHKDTYKMLGIPCDEEKTQPPLSKEDFLKKKCYACYETADLESLLEKLESVKQKIKLILDVGRPDDSALEKMLSEFEIAFENKHFDNVKFYLRLQRKKDVQAFFTKTLPFEIIYYLPEAKPDSDYEKTCKDTFEFCKKQKIKLVSMSDKTFNEEISLKMKEYGVKACVFTYTKTEDIINAIQNGAELAGSHYYTVSYLEKLTK